MNSSSLSTRHLSGDIWGGFAAMLVALPSAIAFGVTILAPLGSHFSAQGAIAGIVGVILLGFIAALFGGTQRLISAPCAPAAAVLSALTIQMSQQGSQAPAILLTLFLVALISSATQIMFGTLRFGQLIRYMPFPVVSGYLSGVGLIIIFSQLPKLLGAPKGIEWFAAISTPALWQPVSLLVGVATGAVMLVAMRFPSRVPAVIQGLAAGIVVYWLLAWSAFPGLASLQDNPFVIGAISTAGDGLWSSITGPWQGLSFAALPQLQQVLIPALTLAVLLSIDTLKTCLILDAVSGTRHNSNRELIGQGLGNLTATLFGGTPGAGTMGASLVNKASGGVTRLSGMFQGVWSLLAFMLLTPLISWVPVAALAGLLIVIGVRMIDWHSLQLARSRATVLDFGVIVAVIVVAKTVSLIAASGLGVALAILMFIREQIHSSTIRNKSYGNALFSKRIRPLAEREALLKIGHQNVVYELQGSLFFGTTDQLYSAIEPDLENSRFVVLDFQRVQSLDMTAAHMIERLRNMLFEQQSTLILSRVPANLPSGRDLRSYTDQLGITSGEQATLIFDDLSDALEWVEDQSLQAAGIQGDHALGMRLEQFELFEGLQPSTLAGLQHGVQKRFYTKGEIIFSSGSPGDALMLIARGAVRIDLTLSNGRKSHIATFGRGQFFGELSFLEPHAHSANVVAAAETELLILHRSDFDVMAKSDPMMAMHLYASLAVAMADRLRHTNLELRALQEA